MTNRRRSATTRSVPAQTPEQLLELTQEHIRPLIGLIDRLNEAGAEDELRVISKHPPRLPFGVTPLPNEKSPQEPPGPPRQQHGAHSLSLSGALMFRPCHGRTSPRKLSRPLPTKDGGTLRTVLDA